MPIAQKKYDIYEKGATRALSLPEELIYYKLSKDRPFSFTYYNHYAGEDGAEPSKHTVVVSQGGYTSDPIYVVLIRPNCEVIDTSYGVLDNPYAGGPIIVPGVGPSYGYYYPRKIWLGVCSKGFLSNVKVLENGYVEDTDVYSTTPYGHMRGQYYDGKCRTFNGRAFNYTVKGFSFYPPDEERRTISPDTYINDVSFRPYVDFTAPKKSGSSSSGGGVVEADYLVRLAMWRILLSLDAPTVATSDGDASNLWMYWSEDTGPNSYRKTRSVVYQALRWTGEEWEILWDVDQNTQRGG